MRDQPISAILLAAGESRRMGTLKQLLSFHGKTFVENCVDNLLASEVAEVVVVTGYRDAEVKSAIGNPAVRYAHNENYRSGMASSIKVGIRAVSTDSKACVVALVDQPQIGADVINRVIEKYQSPALIVIPTYDGKKGHPILLDLNLKDEILQMDDNEGLRQVVREHQDEVSFIEVTSSAILEDCDFPEDYERLLKL
jgi:molybdenum cofactor cytidylyltransferase